MSLYPGEFVGAVIAVTEKNEAARNAGITWDKQGDGLLRLDLMELSLLELEALKQKLLSLLTLRQEAHLMLGLAKSRYIQTFSIPKHILAFAADLNLYVEVTIYEADQ